MRSRLVGISMLSLCLLAVGGGTRGAFAAEPPLGAQPRGERTASIVRMNTLFGPTGLLTVPTAAVTPYRQAQFGTSFARDHQTIALNYGLVRDVEVGATYVGRDTANNEFLANAKVQIIPSNFNWFELGIGVIDATDAINRTGYLVMSADFGVPHGLEDRAVAFRVHLGAGTGIFDNSVFGGAELRLNRRFSLVGEWDTSDLNGALRYTHGDAFRLQVGVRDLRAFLGATYGLTF
jgi:hypothetical protein